jgi:hypothetical protein
MRLAIIPSDTVVCIDNRCIDNIDLSWVPENVHAVQWYDTYGEIELVTNDPNIDIFELGIYENVIDLWEERKVELDKLEEERLEAERIAEEEHQKELLRYEYETALQESSEIISEFLNETELNDVEEETGLSETGLSETELSETEEENG